MCIKDYGIKEGNSANFVVLDEKNVFDAVRNTASTILSVRNGKVIMENSLKNSYNLQLLGAYMKIMHHMTRADFEKAQDNVVVLPVGSTEQHGPHLPLGVDSYIARGISEILSERTGAIVAPTLTYGYKSKPLSGGGPLFKGTIDLNGKTLIDLVYDILCEFARDGYNKIFINNAHFENQAFIEEAMDLACQAFPKLKVVQSNWWDVLDNDTVNKVFSDVPFPGWAFEHAAITETSLMLF